MEVSTNSPPPYEGGCACGAVRYRITARTVGSRVCHCRNCQKVMAGPVLAHAQFPKEAVTWTGQTNRWQSSERLFRHFCGTCGTNLFLEPQDGPRIGVPLATLDDPEAISPELHYWRDSGVSWVSVPIEVPVLPGGTSEPYRKG